MRGLLFTGFLYAGGGVLLICLLLLAAELVNKCLHGAPRAALACRLSGTSWRQGQVDGLRQLLRHFRSKRKSFRGKQPLEQQLMILGKHAARLAGLQEGLSRLPPPFLCSSYLVRRQAEVCGVWARAGEDPLEKITGEYHREVRYLQEELEYLRRWALQASGGPWEVF